MLVWESLKTTCEDQPGNVFIMRRAKVPGGWLLTVGVGNGGGVTFYPDPKHQWDGSSLPKRTFVKKYRSRGARVAPPTARTWTYAADR